MPAHSSGAAASSGMRLGDAQHVVLVDDDRAWSSRPGSMVPSRSTAVVGADVALQAVLLLAGQAVARTRGRSRRSSRRRRGRRPRSLVTSEPTSVDDAGDLVAGRPAGSRAAPHSSRTVWMSEWQMPAYSMSISDVVRADVAALDGGLGQRLGRRRWRRMAETVVVMEVCPFGTDRGVLELGERSESGLSRGA